MMRTGAGGLTRSLPRTRPHPQQLVQALGVPAPLHTWVAAARAGARAATGWGCTIRQGRSQTSSEARGLDGLSWT